MKPAYRVFVIESERGWGQRIDEEHRFRGDDALQNARAYVKEQNAKNNLPQVPDIYWYAEEPQLIDEDVELPNKRVIYHG